MLILLGSHFLMYGRKHVVFGKVVKGMDIVKKIEQVGSARGQPARPVKIVDCGETSESKIEDSVGKDSGKTWVVGTYGLEHACQTFYLHVLYNITFSQERTRNLGSLRMMVLVIKLEEEVKNP
jgi:hypothetical protein